MQSAPILLSTVRQFFSRPDRLEAAGFIHQEIAQRMIERLQLVRLDPEQILDAGCGDGRDVAMLQTLFPKAQILGVDGSLSMLYGALNDRKKHTPQHKGQDKTQHKGQDKAQHNTRLQSAVTGVQASATSGLMKARRLLDTWWSGSGTRLNQRWICADFGNLPLGEQRANVVWSNLALHWHPQPDQVFAEWRRVLKTDGLLMFSCFGPDTFKEIRQAFDSVEATPHTLPFVDMHDFGDMLTQSGFATPVMDMETLTLTYTSVSQLIAEVRAMGGNPLSTRRKSLMGKSAWKTMCDNLEKLRQPDGRISLTLEIIYGHAFKPQPKRLAEGESVVKFHFPKK